MITDNITKVKMADAATLNVVDDELNKWVSWTARLVAAHRCELPPNIGVESAKAGCKTQDL